MADHHIQKWILHPKGSFAQPLTSTACRTLGWMWSHCCPLVAGMGSGHRQRAVWFGRSPQMLSRVSWHTTDCFFSWWTWREHEVSPPFVTWGQSVAPLIGYVILQLHFHQILMIHILWTLFRLLKLCYKIQLFLVWGYQGRKHVPTRVLHWHLKEPALTSYKHHLVCWSALFWGKSVHRTCNSLLFGLRTQISTTYTISQGKLVDTYNYVIFIVE